MLQEEEQRQNRRVRDTSQYLDRSWPSRVQEGEQMGSPVPLLAGLYTFSITFMTPHADGLARNEHLWIIKLRITLARARELLQLSPTSDNQPTLISSGPWTPPQQPYWSILSYFNVSLRSWFNSSRVYDAPSRANHLHLSKGSKYCYFKATQPAQTLHRSSQGGRAGILMVSLVVTEVKHVALALIFMEEEDGLSSEEVDSDYFCSLGVKRGTSFRGVALR